MRLTLFEKTLIYLASSLLDGLTISMQTMATDINESFAFV